MRASTGACQHISAPECTASERYVSAMCLMPDVVITTHFTADSMLVIKNIHYCLQMLQASSVQAP